MGLRPLYIRNSFSAGNDFKRKRQNLTSKVDPLTERVITNQNLTSKVDPRNERVITNHFIFIHDALGNVPAIYITHRGKLKL